MLYNSSTSYYLSELYMYADQISFTIIITHKHFNEWFIALEFLNWNRLRAWTDFSENLKSKVWASAPIVYSILLTMHPVQTYIFIAIVLGIIIHYMRCFRELFNFCSWADDPHAL